MEVKLANDFIQSMQTSRNKIFRERIMEWQLINSAPLGRLVLLSFDGEVGVGTRNGEKYWHFAGLYGSDDYAEPEMWCDIPDAPMPRDL